MKIVSDYRDYYDYLQDYAGETQDVYMRQRKPVKNFDYKDNNPHHNASTYIESIDVPKSSYTYLDFDIIGFCGKLYPVMNRRLNLNRENRWYEKWVYAENDYKITQDHEIIYDKKKMIKLNHSYYINDHANYMNALLNSKTLHSVFLDYKVPLFVGRQFRSDKSGCVKIELNFAPMLHKYQFEQIFPAQQAFQEIEWFFANVIFSRENPDPQITDNIVLRDAKGFDKMSFKNGKKKRGRK